MLLMSSSGIMPGLVREISELSLGLIVFAILIVVLHHLERASGRVVSHRLGWRGVLVTGAVGVPIHEVSHLVVAKLFGHRIIAWRLFDPDPASGTLGYVRHGVRRDTAWQRLGFLFIGLAPLLGGGLALAALVWWMVPTAAWSHLMGLAGQASLTDVTRLEAWGHLMAALARLGRAVAMTIWSARTPWLPLQIFLILAVASHMAPSRSDLRVAGRGLLVALIVLFGAAVLGHLLGIGGLGRAILAGLPLLVGVVAGAGILQGGYVLGLHALGRRRKGGMSLERGDTL
ncbi:MAG: hypothetical protein KAI47_14350 [Deltaproteobacteria bacterium]|nr:hypothetical protein [Deltaproteobacteria bacterium]